MGPPGTAEGGTRTDTPRTKSGLLQLGLEMGESERTLRFSSFSGVYFSISLKSPDSTCFHGFIPALNPQAP